MAVNNIPMMNADIVTGVSLCLLFVVFFNGWHSFAVWVNGWQSLVVLPERLTLGFGTLLIAHICFNIPYVILSVGPKLRQMDRNLVDAAQDLGCTWMQAFWKVIIPEIKPGIVSGALTAFTMSIDDFIISYFTAGTSSSTLAMTIYGMTKSASARRSTPYPRCCSSRSSSCWPSSTCGRTMPSITAMSITRALRSLLRRRNIPDWARRSPQALWPVCCWRY